MSTKKGFVYTSAGEGFLGRYIKPGYEWYRDNEIRIRASANRPAYFVIGGKATRVTGDLLCNLAASGAGGMVAGISLTANTPYYLYAYDNNGSVALTTDERDPSEGPRNTDSWTYIGAIASKENSANLERFVSSGGEYWAATQIENYSHTGDTISTPQVFNALPLTARAAEFRFDIDGNNVPAVAQLSPDGVNVTLTTSQFPVGNFETRMTGKVPILTAQTVYHRVNDAADEVTTELMGWVEDPSEWL